MGLFDAFCKTLSEEVRKEYHHLRLKPLDAMGFMTYRCTSRCKTCTIWKRKVDVTVDELSVEQWLSVADRLRQAGVRSFEVFGGDAFLRKDVVFDMIKRCDSHGLKTYFPTNTNLCDEETAAKLVASGLGTLYVSLDDLSEDHDQIRGVNGTFGRVRQALEDILAARGEHSRPQVIVCTTLSRFNFRNFPKLLAYLERYPINAVDVRPLGEFSAENVAKSMISGQCPEPYFSSSDGESHLLRTEDLADFRRMLAQVQKTRYRFPVYLRLFHAANDDSLLRGVHPHRHCHIATTFVTILPNGDVTPCPFFRSYVIGNLCSTDLSEIWGNQKHRKFVQLQQSRQLPICLNCNMRLDYPSVLEQADYYIGRAKSRLRIAS